MRAHIVHLSQSFTQLYNMKLIVIFLATQILSELQKNEPKALKSLSRAQNRTPAGPVLCPASLRAIAAAELKRRWLDWTPSRRKAS